MIRLTVRPRLTGAVLLTLAFLLAACGADDPSPAEDGEATTASTSDGAESAEDSADGSTEDSGEDSGDGTDADSAEAADVNSGEAADENSGEAADENSGEAADVNSGEAVTKPDIDPEWLGETDELETIDVVVGDGREAQAGGALSMQYVGVLASDGSQFDASWDRGQPFNFTLGAGQVITGWDQGIAGMREGGRRVLRIPSGMAYGERGSGDAIPPDSDLVFVVDLVSAEEPPPPPEPAPPVPEDALGAVDELEIIDLVDGSGRAAERGDILVVQYVGVNADDGVEFDSTWSRGMAPFSITAGMSQVIDGWNEGLIGMAEGGERLLRIPAEKAYGTDDLIFRVHLDELIEAPVAHLIEIEGSPVTETTSTVLEAGQGSGASAGDTINAHLALYVHSSGQMVQSTYQNQQTEQLPLTDDALLPGLADALDGIELGEIRRVDLPLSVAFPDGVPENAGFENEDAVIFVVEREG